MLCYAVLCCAIPTPSFPYPFLITLDNTADQFETNWGDRLNTFQHISTHNRPWKPKAKGSGNVETVFFYFGTRDLDDLGGPFASFRFHMTDIMPTLKKSLISLDTLGGQWRVVELPHGPGGATRSDWCSSPKVRTPCLVDTSRNAPGMRGQSCFRLWTHSLHYWVQTWWFWEEQSHRSHPPF